MNGKRFVAKLLQLAGHAVKIAVDKAVGGQRAAEIPCCTACQHIIFRIGGAAAEVRHNDMPADGAFLCADFLPVFHRVAVARKIQMRIFAQVGKCFTHNHNDVRTLFCADRGCPIGVLQCPYVRRSIPFGCLDLHDVELMQEGINHTACVVLVHLKIRIVHSRVAVIQRLICIPEVICPKAAGKHKHKPQNPWQRRQSNRLRFQKAAYRKRREYNQHDPNQHQLINGEGFQNGDDLLC